jgi:hypothetical protein
MGNEAKGEITISLPYLYEVTLRLDLPAGPVDPVPEETGIFRPSGAFRFVGMDLTINLKTAVALKQEITERTEEERLGLE